MPCMFIDEMTRSSIACQRYTACVFFNVESPMCVIWCVRYYGAIALLTLCLGVHLELSGRAKQCVRDVNERSYGGCHYTWRTTHMIAYDTRATSDWGARATTEYSLIGASWVLGI